MPQDLIFPMAAHVVWCACLYVLLTVARTPSVWGIGNRSWQMLEPRISANLSNQFEWPLLFFVVCLLLIQADTRSAVLLHLAWLFVIGRVVHSGVQILSANIRLRGLVFTINFLAVLLMWTWLVIKHTGIFT
jgi:hypothetical protein